MKRVEFRLTMPGRASWDGRWSGDGKTYSLERSVDDAQAAELDGRSWTYAWPDGWRAEVSARVVGEHEERPASAGFRGYDWMVDSVLRHGEIYAGHEQPKTQP